MITIRNLTNSPFDIQTVNGNVRLPAFGEASGEFSGEYLQLLKASMSVEVVTEREAEEMPEKSKKIKKRNFTRSE